MPAIPNAGALDLAIIMQLTRDFAEYLRASEEVVTTKGTVVPDHP